MKEAKAEVAAAAAEEAKARKALLEQRKLHKERLELLRAAAANSRARATESAQHQAALAEETKRAEERLAAAPDEGKLLALAPPSQLAFPLAIAGPSQSLPRTNMHRFQHSPSGPHVHQQHEDAGHSVSETPPSVEQLVKKARRLEGEQKVCRQEWREGEIEEIKYDLERRRTRFKHTGSWR